MNDIDRLYHSKCGSIRSGAVRIPCKTEHQRPRGGNGGMRPLHRWAYECSWHLQYESCPPEDSPSCTGRWDAKGQERRLLIYGHYDVQPPEPLDEWTTPPFSPSIRDGRIYARGSGDNKGPHFAHLKAIESFLAVKRESPHQGQDSPGRGRRIGKHPLGLPSSRATRSFSPPTGSSRRTDPCTNREDLLVFLGVRGIVTFELEASRRQPGLPFRQGRRGAQPGLGARASAGNNEEPAGAGIDRRVLRRPAAA